MVIKQNFIFAIIIHGYLSVFLSLYPSDPWVENTLKSLSLRQKIAQLFVIAAVSERNQPTPELQASLNGCPYPIDRSYVEKMVSTYGVGGVIFLWNSDPIQQIRYTQELQAKSSVPLLVAFDAEWGLTMRLTLKPELVVQYPRNLALGAIQKLELISAVGQEIANQCKAIGVHLNLAPVVDINTNAANPIIHTRSFGDTPEHVIKYSRFFIRNAHPVCLKHFPGHGNTTVDSHTALPLITADVDSLTHNELSPFISLFDTVEAVMTAHLAVPALTHSNTLPISVCSDVIQDIRHKYHFNGLIITDGLGMGALTNTYKAGEIELKAFLAGNDILLCPLDVPKAIDYIEKALQKGEASLDDLDNRVRRVLTFKQKHVLPNMNTLQQPLNDTLAYLIRPHAYELQEQLYQEAMTLVKQSNPVDLQKCTLIQSGVLPDNICFELCRSQAYASHLISENPSAQEIDTLTHTIAPCNDVILLIGSMNYILQKNFGISQQLVRLIDTLKERSINVHIVLFGTPYAIAYVKNADTVFVAYESCVPAQRAMAHILQGTQKAHGKLSISIAMG